MNCFFLSFLYFLAFLEIVLFQIFSARIPLSILLLLAFQISDCHYSAGAIPVLWYCEAEY